MRWLRLLRLLHQLRWLRWLRLLRHLRSIYCSFGFWGPILPIVLRIGALDALAALAARSCTSCAGCAGCACCVTCVQYIVHWAFILPIVLRIGALDALAALAARSCTSCAQLRFRQRSCVSANAAKQTVTPSGTWRVLEGLDFHYVHVPCKTVGMILDQPHIDIVWYPKVWGFQWLTSYEWLLMLKIGVKNVQADWLITKNFDYMYINCRGIDSAY